MRLKGGRLTNLTLTKHNSTYQNKPFPDKKGKTEAIGHCYAKSPLYVARQLTQWDNWDANAIDERRSTLLEWARHRWTIDWGGLQDEVREPTLPDEFDEEDGLFVSSRTDEL